MLKEPKHRALAIMFASVMLTAVTQSPDAMAETKEVEIILGAGGPVFKDPDITIKTGDTVRWIVKIGEHHLEGKPKTNGFKETDDFDAATNPPVNQTFDEARVLDYHCIFHPGTMVGKITVK